VGIGVVSEHFPRLRRTSDRPWRGWGGVGRLLGGGKISLVITPLAGLGGWGVAPGENVGGAANFFRCVLTPPHIVAQHLAGATNNPADQFVAEVEPGPLVRSAWCARLLAYFRLDYLCIAVVNI
jgi:hypothetical protein